MEVSEGETVVEDGRSFLITATPSKYGIRLVVQASVDDLRRGEPRFALEAEAVRYRAVHPDGTILAVHSWHLLEYEVREHEQGVLLDGFENQLKALTAACEELEEKGYSTAVLSSRIDTARDLVNLFGGWRETITPERIMAALAACENERELVQTDPAWVLLRDILSGNVWHRHHYENQAVIGQTAVLAIRSGGQIEALTPEWVGGYYADCLYGVDKLSAAQQVDLRFRLEDFVPSDPDTSQFAPEHLVLTDRRGEAKRFPLEYEYAEVDGKPVPAGRATVPRSVYEAHVRRHGLPTLPHGIQLYLILTVESQEVVRGFVGEQLDKRLKAAAKGNRRGA